AIWPFGAGQTFRRVGQDLYQGPANLRIAFMHAGSQSYLASPALRLQRVPWLLDVRWIAPAFVASLAVRLLTLPAWPIAGLWRRWRKRRWSEDGGDRRKHLAVRLVLLVDALVIVAVATPFIMSAIDPTIYNDALDPLLLVLYALAWLGALG